MSSAPHRVPQRGSKRQELTGAHSSRGQGAASVDKPQTPACLGAVSQEAGRGAPLPKKEACGLERWSYFSASPVLGQPRVGALGTSSTQLSPGSRVQVKAGRAPGQPPQRT